MKENKVVALIVKFLTVILLMAVAIFLFSVAPYYKPTETFERGVMHFVVDDKDVTNSLPAPVYVQDDVVMISDKTAMKYFDNIYVYYDEKYDTAIITSEKKVGKIKLGENTITINGEEQALKGTATFKMIEKTSDEESAMEKTLYIPISSIKDITDVDFVYNKKVIATTLRGYSRLKIVELASTHKLKAYKKEIALTTGVAKKGELLYVFDTEEKELTDYLVVRNERGDIGYCQYQRINASDIMKSTQKIDEMAKYKNLVDKVKYTLVWEYAQNVTPNRNGETKIDRLQYISPTWIEVKNKDADIVTTIDSDYINWAKGQNYKLWPTLKNDFISMDNMDDLSAIMTDMQLREKLINNVVKVALQYGFDGINLDFENMYKADKDVFSQFVREFSSTLRANGLVSSVDVTIAGGSDTYSLCYDRTAIGKAADYVMLMAYDQYGNWSATAGPVASLSWVKANIQEMLNYENVDKDKLFLCVPFYSRYWVVNSETNEKIRSSAIPMNQANLYLERYKDNAKWSEEDGQYYIELDQGNGTTIKIWVENEEALNKKIELVNEFDLAGVAVWRWGYEDGNKAWKTIANTLNLQ